MWAAIEQGLEAAPVERSRWGRLGAIGAAAAALLMVAVLVGPGNVPGPTAEPVAAVDQLARIQAVSDGMDARLVDWRDGVIDAGQADVLARMERELAWVDAEIAKDPENPALWVERVALQSEMMQRYLSSDWRSELMLSAY
jgi:hypothetical protein